MDQCWNAVQVIIKNNSSENSDRVYSPKHREPKLRFFLSEVSNNVCDQYYWIQAAFFGMKTGTTGTWELCFITDLFDYICILNSEI